MPISCPCTLNADRISLPASPLPEPRAEAPLTSSEKLRVHSVLSQVQSDLAELDDAVAHLQSVQKRLLSKREALQAFSDKHKKLLCPARLMPSEILVEIFSYFKVPWGQMSPSLAAQSMVLLPASVCQQWRQIALSTPSLWNHIFLDLYRSEGRLELEWLKFWLPHSKDCPLSIDIMGHTVSNQDKWNAILDILLPQSGRWKHAIIYFQHETDFSKVKNNLPLLETLQIKTVGNITLDIADVFQVAPLLRGVNMSVNRLRGVFQLPWTQLSSFNASKCFVEQSLALLRMMPNIVSFTAKLIMDNINPHVLNDPSIDYPVRLSKLKNLDLSHGAGIDHFFDRLELPSLETFSFVEYNEGLHTGWSASLVSLIQRSSCDSIRVFWITAETTGSQASVEDVIRVCPNLGYLHLGNLDPSVHSGYDKVIQSLTVTSSPIGGTQPNVAPALHKLHLEYAEGLDTHSLMNMLDSRCGVNSKVAGQPVARLKDVILDVPDATVFGTGELYRLRVLSADGLNIDVQVAEGEPIVF